MFTINTGKVFNEINARKGTYFVSMCLKEHRRVFIQNNKNEILFYTIDDGSLVINLTRSLVLRTFSNKTKQNPNWNCRTKYLQWNPPAYVLLRKNAIFLVSVVSFISILITTIIAHKKVFGESLFL